MRRGRNHHGSSGVRPDVKTLALLLTVIVLAAAACGGASGPSIDAGDEPTGSWLLIEGEGPDGPVPILETHRITLDIEAGRVGGTAACNHYGGEATIDGSGITIHGISVTEMACDPPEAMESERLYLAALGDATAFERSGEELTLSGPGTLLAFEALEPPPTADLIGTRWELDSLVHGSGPDAAVSSARGGFLLLEADGTLSGSTGCRDLSGEWVESVDTIATPSLGAAGGCTPELEAQDAHVIEVLEGFHAEIDGQRLTLTTPNGGSGLGFQAPSERDDSS